MAVAAVVVPAQNRTPTRRRAIRRPAIPPGPTWLLRTQRLRSRRRQALTHQPPRPPADPRWHKINLLPRRRQAVLHQPALAAVRCAWLQAPTARRNQLHQADSRAVDKALQAQAGG